MERVSVLRVLLLLLLCSLSGAELQDNEISEQRQVGPESVNVPEQPQPFPSDLHAVLQDMSATLAEHRVRIQQLHALNQEQAAKLREQAVEMIEQAAKLRELEMKTNNVYSQQQVGQVAFSTSLLASGSGDIGPFNTQVPLVFRFVITNIGNAYNPNSGFFTAPVRGAYHFELHIGGNGRSSHPSGAFLVRNGRNICIAYEHQSNGYGKSSNGATLLLEAGDIVFARQFENTIIHDNGNHHSTFSGHLLFTM